MELNFDLDLTNLKQYYNNDLIIELKNCNSINNFLKIIKKLSDKTIQNLIIIFNYNYYHDNNFLIPDQYFDILYKYAKDKNLYMEEICYDLEEIELPEEMNTIKKFYITDKEKIEKNISKNFLSEILITSKLDGVSCLLKKNKNKIFLYTKGNSEKGRNITHILKNINFDISKLDKIEKCILRGELIIKKENKKFFNLEKSLRSQVIGLINLKKDTEKLQQYIDIVFYQIYSSFSEHYKHFTFFKNNNLLYPKYEIESIDNIEDITQFLSDKYDEFIEKEIYEIDGLVITNPNIKIDFKKKNYTDYYFAFKKNIYFADVKVINIIWNISKTCKCIPVLEIEPTKISSSMVKKINGFNAKKLLKEKIGIGSIIRIKLSGNVIPNIDYVIKPSNDIPFPLNFYWDENNVNIYVNECKKDKLVLSKKLLKYYSNFKIKHFAPLTIVKVLEYFNNKNIYNIFDYIDVLEEYFKKENQHKILGEKKDELLHDSIKKFRNYSISIINILIATNKFKLFEETKFLLIFKNYPDIVKILKTKNSTIEDIDQNKLYEIDSINEKNIINFMKGLKYFLKYKEKFNTYFNINYEVVIKQTSINVVFTGVKEKDKQCLSYLKNFYTEFLCITNNKEITYVIVKDENYNISEKINKAKKYNIPIKTIKEFYEILKKLKT